MTKAEAAELQAKWAQQVDLPLCEHLKIDLERTADDCATGNYHCTTCGHSVPR